jgi:site-specific DNA-methyltransferase (cytosine-N4-specific)
VVIVRGDALDLLDHVEPGSVQCCVTSPPYLKQRRYGDDPREGGLQDDLASYVGWLADVFDRVRDALDPTGLAWMNIGDKGNGSGGAGGDWADAKKPLGVTSGPGRFEDPAFETGSFLDVPGAVVAELLRRGWRLRMTVVWAKGRFGPDGAWRAAEKPEQLRHVMRPRPAHEMIYMLSPTKRARKRHEPRPKFHPERLVETGSVWHFPPGGSGPSHLAPFPRELARRCIAPSTDPGDLVLDPFMGSGTVARVAEAMGRRAIGLDLYAEGAESQTADEVGKPEVPLVTDLMDALADSVERAKAARADRIQRGREGGTVIGCVHGAHRRLAERWADFPDYAWAEAHWTATLRKRAPAGGALPAWLEQELWCLWRREDAEERAATP